MTENAQRQPDGTTALTKLPTYETHFILEAGHTDWDYLIQSLIVRYREANPKLLPEDAFAFVTDSGVARYYLSKAVFPVAEIAKLIGSTAEPERLNAAKIFRLGEQGDQSKWQKPTVPYAGAA